MREERGKCTEKRRGVEGERFYLLPGKIKNWGHMACSSLGGKGRQERGKKKEDKVNKKNKTQQSKKKSDKKISNGIENPKLY